MEIPSEEEELIGRAERGDTTAARELLTHFVQTVADATDSRGRPLTAAYNVPDSVVGYLAKCLAGLGSLRKVTGKDLLAAFNLTGGRRGRRPRSRQRDLDVWVAVVREHHSQKSARRPRSRRHDDDLTRAFTAVAARLALSGATVKRAYERTNARVPKPYRKIPLINLDL